MYVKEIITRIRDNCPSLEQRVSPSHDLERDIIKKADDSSRNLPFAVVMSARILAEDKAQEEDCFQNVNETIAVLVCVDNKPRRKNAQDLSPYDQLQTIYQEIFNTLTVWAPTFNGDKFQFNRGFQFQVTEARLYWLYEFNYGYVMKVTDPPADQGALIKETYTANVPGEDGSVPAEDYCQLTDSEGNPYEPTP
jgi:hypothetical protein